MDDTNELDRDVNVKLESLDPRYQYFRVFAKDNDFREQVFTHGRVKGTKWS